MSGSVLSWVQGWKHLWERSLLLCQGSKTQSSVWWGHTLSISHRASSNQSLLPGVSFSNISSTYSLSLFALQILGQALSFLTLNNTTQYSLKDFPYFKISPLPKAGICFKKSGGDTGESCEMMQYSPGESVAWETVNGLLSFRTE